MLVTFWKKKQDHLRQGTRLNRKTSKWRYGSM